MQASQKIIHTTYKSREFWLSLGTMCILIAYDAYDVAMLGDFKYNMCMYVVRCRQPTIPTTKHTPILQTRNL